MRLNDLFGVQARGGCACAGPYAQQLLGIDPTTAKAFDEAGVRPMRRTGTDREGPGRTGMHGDLGVFSASLPICQALMRSAQEVLRPGGIAIAIAHDVIALCRFRPCGRALYHVSK